MSIASATVLLSFQAAAQTGSSKPTYSLNPQVAAVVNTPLVTIPPKPQPPDYLAIRKANDARVAAEQAAKDALEAAQRAEALKEQQLATQKAQAAQRASEQPTTQIASTPVIPATVGNCQDWMNQAGIVDQATAILVINRESGCNPNAVNPGGGACGIGQQLPCGKWPHQWNDPVGALIDMQNYVFGTYGSWANAWQHELSFGWY